MEIKEKENLITQNMLIAQFMGITPELIEPDCYKLSNTPFWSITGDTPDKVLKNASILLDYHNDWNKLMQVIKKILIISLENDNMELYYNITDAMPFIQQVHEEVINFINDYNAKK